MSRGGAPILGKKKRKKKQREEQLAGQAKQNWALPLAQSLYPPLLRVNNQLTVLCSMKASQSDVAVGNSPMEWHL